VSCPGNPGLAALGEVAPGVDPADPEQVLELVRDASIDFVVVGPEGPLAAGVSDALTKAGVTVFGPPSAGARLESSKSFAKEIMAAANIPTAASVTFMDAVDAYAHLAMVSSPYVVKADGLAAGKGVLVTESLERAQRWVDDCLDGRFGGEGSSVVIEEFLDGTEVSIFFICANGAAIALEPARDYKQLADGDTGPNTGGMGSFSPVEDLPADLVSWTQKTIAEPTLSELARRGIDYVGFLYVGLMLTADGPKVVEFNCRLGDPETQTLMPRLDSDLLATLHNASTVGLDDVSLEWRPLAAVNVVMASKGYPDAPTTGYDIRGLDSVDGAATLVFHAGTAFKDDRVVTSGGRVLSIVGLGPDRTTARTSAYDAVAHVEFTGKQFRSDIAQ
jgi:phosphoribosylamine--glycine ligase